MSAEWLRRQGVQVSEFGARVADLVGELYKGIYHIGSQALKADWSKQGFVSVVVPDSRLSTYDSSLLTHLVILAHTRNIRAEIKAASPSYLRLQFMPVTRSGFFVDRHPTLRESLEKFNAVGMLDC